jgi:Family of unknown function (DUF5654)
MDSEGKVNEIKNDTIIYILGAFTFALGLAWNEAIISAIDSYYPLNEITAKFIYAIGLTFLIVIFGRYVFGKRPKDRFIRI